MKHAVKMVPVMVFLSVASAVQAQALTPAAQAEAVAGAQRSVVSASKPPPPTIADLVLLLQSYKPDPERIARLRAEMDEAVPATDDPDLLAAAWHRKALAAGELQELEQRSEFLEKALEPARRAKGENASGVGSYLRVRTEYADSLFASRSVTAALDSFAEFIAENE